MPFSVMKSPAVPLHATWNMRHALVQSTHTAYASHWLSHLAAI